MKKLNSFFASIFLSIFIISFIPNIVLSSKFFYNLHIDPLKLTSYINLTKDQIENNYSVLIDYLMNESISKLKFPDLTMSKEGEIHFEEVKGIFINLKKSTIVCGILSLIFCTIEIVNKRYNFLKYTSILIFAPVVILAIASFVNFDMLFIAFHKLVFNNSFWIFDYKKDPVIQMLPEQFFLNCLIYILFLIFSFSIVLFMVYKWLKRVKIR